MLKNCFQYVIFYLKITEQFKIYVFISFFQKPFFHAIPTNTTLFFSHFSLTGLSGWSSKTAQGVK